jgi:long-chain fatty acid transport protein
MMQSKADFSLGISGINSLISFQKFESDITAETDNSMSTPFYVYGAGKINEKWSVGLAIYTPYGNSSKWEDSWAGRLLIQNIALQAIFFQPTIAYKISDKIGIGAGLVYATGKVEIQKGLNYGPDSYVYLDGSTSNIGFNIGLYFEAIDKLSFGLNYRSEIVMEVSGGDATFNVPAAVGTSIPASNKFDAALPMPANLDFGVSYQATEKLLLSAEINYVMWENTIIPRIGIEYVYSDLLTFRIGGYYDPSPANEKYFTPETVSLNNLAFTLGLSITPSEKLSIDLSYLQIHGLQATKTYEPDQFGGTYETAAYIPGIGVSYRF